MTASSATDGKTCRACREVKTQDEFGFDRRTKDGRTVRCLACLSSKQQRWRTSNRTRERRSVYGRSLLRNYGITLETYEDMLVAQGGLCAACCHAETARNRDGTPRRLHVDHDHASRQVRGLLCSGCNIVLGTLKIGPTPSLSSYLKEWGKDLSSR